MDFSWSDKEEDSELYHHGLTLLWIAGDDVQEIQRFVEALSYRIGRKCDFACFIDKAHVDVYEDAWGDAVSVVQDAEWVEDMLPTCRVVKQCF